MDVPSSFQVRRLYSFRVVLERNHSNPVPAPAQRGRSHLHGRVHRVRQRHATLVERALSHAAEQLIAAARQVVHDHIHAARTRRSFGSRNGRGAAARGRAFTACAACRATGALRRAPAQHQVTRRWRELEGLNVLPRFDCTGGEVAQLHAARRRRHVLRWRRGPGPAPGRQCPGRAGPGARADWLRAV
jgi:hypothetical protein